MTKATKLRIVINILRGVPVLQFLQSFALDFHIFVCNFSRDFLTDKCIQKFKKVVLGLLGHVTPKIFVRRILRSEA